MNIITPCRQLKFFLPEPLVLCLEGCRFEIREDIIDLPALRKLYLTRIQCDDLTIQKLISSCPLIEDLKTSSCYQMQWLHVFGPVNLQRLSITDCIRLEIIEVYSPSSESLRELILNDNFITEDLLLNLLSRLPNLEQLETNDTLLMDRIEISHHQLKRLDLRVDRAEAILKIETPNLRSLTYYGYRMPLISLKSSLHTSSLLEFDFRFLKDKVSSHSP